MASLIRKAASEYLHRAGVLEKVFIYDVQMADKKTAQIIYEPKTDDISFEHLVDIQKDLEKITPQLRHHISQETQMKATPHVVFSPKIEK